MKIVAFIRHAKSSWEYPHLTDSERPLNARGMSDAPLMGQELMKRKIIPDQIIHSKAKRAIMTADLIRSTINSSIPTLSSGKLYFRGANAIADVVRNSAHEVNVLFVVSHNPDLEDLLWRWPEFRPDKFVTCGTVILSGGSKWKDFGPDTFHFEEYLFPKMFRT